MHGLPIMEQEVGGGISGSGGPGGEARPSVEAGTGWGLGGAGPVLKTQTVVSILACLCVVFTRPFREGEERVNSQAPVFAVDVGWCTNSCSRLVLGSEGKRRPLLY